MMYHAFTDSFQLDDLWHRTGSRRAVELPPDFAGELHEICWSQDGSVIFATASLRGRSRLFRIDVSGGTPPAELAVPHGNSALLVVPAPSVTTPPTSQRLLFLQASFHSPAELHTCQGSGEHHAKLSAANDGRLAAIQPGPPPTELFCPGFLGEEVQSWLFQPLGFDASQVVAECQSKYPMVVIVHGGPQGSIQDGWSYRWNPAVYAAAGYVVLCVNFHGSTGWGAKFREAVSKDWAGAPFEDVIKATDHALASLPHVDRQRVGALGASFGGYMMNLINGRNQCGRYRCLVNHDGIFDCSNVYYTTEEVS
jgi:dipeptidyl aminopeptidase/acylaminoacyl peptidase